MNNQQSQHTRMSITQDDKADQRISDPAPSVTPQHQADTWVVESSCNKCAISSFSIQTAEVQRRNSLKAVKSCLAKDHHKKKTNRRISLQEVTRWDEASEALTVDSLPQLPNRDDSFDDLIANLLVSNIGIKTRKRKSLISKAS